MTDSRNGGSLLVEALSAHGVSCAFGVVSVHNLPLVDALARDLRWVPTRTEAGALNAADGYARVSDGLGCAVTSTGTGAGNAAGALIEALTAGSSVLHVTGQVDEQYLGSDRGVIHEFSGQRSMLDAVSTRAWTVGVDADADAGAVLSEAIRSALQGTPTRGPVSVEWPIDLQFAAAGPPVQVDTIARSVRPSDADLDRAAEIISEARRPLVWAGGGARWAREELDAFLTHIGAGLVTSNSGRGVIAEDDDRVVGNFGSSAVGAELLAEADVLISIGTHFRSNETRSYRLELPARHVQIDLDPRALGRSYPATVGLEADAGPCLTALTARVESSAVASWRERVTDCRRQARAALRRDIGSHEGICDSIRRHLPRHAPLVRDITIPNSAWGNRLLEVYNPVTNIYPRGGGIGQAIGMAIGASVASPEVTTLALVGDGGLQVQLGELATIVQEQLPIVVVVFDDGGYGVLRNMQDRHLDRRAGVDLSTPDYVAVARAHGIDAHDVGDVDDFDRAFQEAAGSGRPALIRVDCARLGDMAVPFVPPVHIPGST